MINHHGKEYDMKKKRMLKKKKSATNVIFNPELNILGMNFENFNSINKVIWGG